MATLTRASILAADDLAKETVSVPEWGGEIIIGTMRAIAQYDAQGAQIVQRLPEGKVGHRIPLCLCPAQEIGDIGIKPHIATGRAPQTKGPFG
jgi:hypothetical protein